MSPPRRSMAPRASIGARASARARGRARTPGHPRHKPVRPRSGRPAAARAPPRSPPPRGTSPYVLVRLVAPRPRLLSPNVFPARGAARRGGRALWPWQLGRAAAVHVTTPRARAAPPQLLAETLSKRIPTQARLKKKEFGSREATSGLMRRLTFPRRGLACESAPSDSSCGAARAPTQLWGNCRRSYGGARARRARDVLQSGRARRQAVAAAQRGGGRGTSQ